MRYAICDMAISNIHSTMTFCYENESVFDGEQRSPSLQCNHVIVSILDAASSNDAKKLRHRGVHS